MRYPLAVLFVGALGTSAAAAPPPPVQPPQLEIPPQLTDPATADRLADMMQALSKAFLGLPVGQVRAAAEGRKASPGEERLTVRDIGRRQDPDFDRNFAQQIAHARPVVQQSMKALNEALPAINRSLSEAASAMQRAVDNMPQPYDPGY